MLQFNKLFVLFTIYCN